MAAPGRPVPNRLDFGDGGADNRGRFLLGDGAPAVGLFSGEPRMTHQAT